LRREILIYSKGFAECVKPQAALQQAEKTFADPSSREDLAGISRAVVPAFFFMPLPAFLFFPAPYFFKLHKSFHRVFQTDIEQRSVRQEY
jgi:hypothetical protein